ncbi:orotidine-5'-phosphate decarboxylase [candidate division KSB3 bacterium]|uniref:Orotidine 5'-phosphate decarboxylase n=1 Tax=candidate division KSB3 bacterium TaxID=2044937 RepID=A0A2G6E1I3_9BACT|nr:MAG: orotidine-5'-phosphate decarboxylase [candidate division KSB3 bacterium]PIE28335.1 MAG: orotidine-5'-phosphate decarboxylase [candidate division KSB3 bacterium]
MARSKVCLALDNFHHFHEVRSCIEELSPVAGMFKIGKELFTRFGPQVVEVVRKSGAEVFLDLKYHDIPNTVKKAACAATELGVFVFDVHASGGLAMMRAALEGSLEAVDAYDVRLPRIIGVTILTSIDRQVLNHEIRIPGSVEEQVLHLASLTKESGLHGIVCSAADLSAITAELPADFLYVTPGIKGPNTAAGSDQKRVFSPRNAVQDGASILVIGRAITAAADRLQAGKDLLEDIAQVL